jgi:hypothetical protein
VLTSHTSLGFTDQPLVHRGRNSNSRVGTISFTLTRLDYSAGIESVRVQTQLADVGASRVAKRSRQDTASGSSSGGMGVGNEVKDLAGVCKSLEDKVQLVADIGNEIAEVRFVIISS